MELIYDYCKLMVEMARLGKFMEVGLLGKSSQNRGIPYAFYGNRHADNILICGSIHAREYITTSLIFMQIERLLSVQKLKNIGITFIPMINVDGVELCLKGLESICSQEKRDFLYEINGKSQDFSLYKANTNGVDLNNNFAAEWGKDTNSKKLPSPSGFIGERPESESETKYLVNFTRRLKPKAVLSYHTKGEVIFWDFNLKGKERERHLKKAKVLANTTGYGLVGNGTSCGGFKDWAIDELGAYGYTVEVGSDYLKHPILSDSLGDIYIQNKNVLEALYHIVKERD